jgi:rhodanese-related sulfurtransferase
MNKLFTLLFLTISLFGTGKDYYSDDIDVEEAYELQKDGAILLDVRTPSEFIHTGHGLGFVNVPVLFQEYKAKSLDIVENFAKMELEKKKAFDSRKIYTTKIIDNPNFLKDVLKLTGGDLETEIVVICHSGERSKFAANTLAKNGFENIYNLDGGFLAWQKSKYSWSVD